jgi:CubicO group peptidase (beta-lactamase class C family)
MDSVIERYLKRWEINGAQLVITRNDSLLYARGFGMADKERGIRMEPNMLMRFASVSKLITAVGIMKLQEMKKLKLNEKVFGEKGILRDTVYNNSIKDKRYYDITVEQLLRHQAGFNNYAGDPVSSTRYIMMQNHLKTPPDHPTLLKILLKRHLGYTPGEGKCYSNLGYMILSMIIEKKSGMKYENFMQKYVLHPAGCYDMHIAGTYLKDRRPNETKYYMHQGSSRFIASIDGLPHVKDILSKKSIEFMTREQADHQYSIGWNYTPKSNKPWIRTGSLAGTSAIVLKYPDNQCWILITNTSTWKGHGFSNDTMAFFEKLRKKYMANMPKKDLFL